MNIPNKVTCQSPNQILAISVQRMIDSIRHIITLLIVMDNPYVD